MRAQHGNEPPSLLRVEQIERGERKNVKVRVRWFYCPEVSKHGRLLFQGAKDLFLWDQYETQGWTPLSSPQFQELCEVRKREHIKAIIDALYSKRQ